jgi:hypothetical protein
MQAKRPDPEGVIVMRDAEKKFELKRVVVAIAKRTSSPSGCGRKKNGKVCAPRGPGVSAAPPPPATNDQAFGLKRGNAAGLNAFRLKSG